MAFSLSVGVILNSIVMCIYAGLSIQQFILGAYPQSGMYLGYAFAGLCLNWIIK